MLAEMDHDSSKRYNGNIHVRKLVRQHGVKIKYTLWGVILQECNDFLALEFDEVRSILSASGRGDPVGPNEVVNHDHRITLVLRQISKTDVVYIVISQHLETITASMVLITSSHVRECTPRKIDEGEGRILVHIVVGV